MLFFFCSEGTGPFACYRLEVYENYSCVECTFDVLVVENSFELFMITDAFQIRLIFLADISSYASVTSSFPCLY